MQSSPATTNRPLRGDIKPTLLDTIDFAPGDQLVSQSHTKADPVKPTKSCTGLVPQPQQALLPSQAVPSADPVPNITLQLSSLPAMEPGWQSHQGFFHDYYPSHDPIRSAERQTTSPPTQQNQSGGSGNNLAGDEASHRRAATQPSHPTFLPPPPPQPSHSSGQQMNLPPFSSTFYQSSYPPTGNHHHQSSSLPSAMHLGYGGPGGPPSGNQGGMQAPAQHYPHYITSPMAVTSSLGRSGPQSGPGHPFESPRGMPGPPGGWSSSPGLRHLSPTSPTVHLAPPGMPASSASTSSSSFPSATRTPGQLPPTNKKRSGSTSAESWDEGESGKGGMSLELGEETDDQPWGMPQDQYKSLNPRDKKQVRNRIGARRFRAKRKDYVQTLERENAELRNDADRYRSEIRDLKQRLGISITSPPIVDGPSGGLGLVVPDGWHDTK